MPQEDQDSAVTWYCTEFKLMSKKCTRNVRNCTLVKKYASRPQGHFYMSESTGISQEETTVEKKRRKKLNTSVTHPLETVCVKHEPEWDREDADYELSEEHEPGPVVLKEELELGPMVVKEELELGPMVLQPPDAVYSLPALLKKEETDCDTQAVPGRTCSVRLEHMLVDMDLSLCKIGKQIYEFQSYLEKDSSHSDEELKSTKKFGTRARLVNEEGQAKTNESKTSLQKGKEIRKRKMMPNSDKRPHRCSYCSAMFSCNSRLLRHIRTHTGEKPFKCGHCNSMFTNKFNLRVHLRTHTGEKPYKCNYCSSTFSQNSSLQVHLRKHTGEKPFKCDHCTSMFTDKSSLRSHLRGHTGEKPFKCDHCTSMFRDKSNLRSHLRTHTGEKPYKCNQCSFTFTQSSGLQVHLRTHTGEKPYKCSHCSSSFAQSGSLRGHLRTHTGEKPFKCEQCSFTCAQSCNLRAHLRTHTPMWALPPLQPALAGRGLRRANDITAVTAPRLHTAINHRAVHTFVTIVKSWH